MSTFHRSDHFHHKTTRTTMQRVRCIGCRSYFERESAYWTNGMSRVCTEACFNEWQAGKQRRARVAARRAPKTPIELRFAVKERDGYCCRWCGSQGTEVHHILYRSQGGPDVEHNLILLCNRCHALAHSNKRQFQPLLLGYIWLLYAEGKQLTIPQVMCFVDLLNPQVDTAV